MPKHIGRPPKVRKIIDSAYPWIIAREANVLSKAISAHQAFLLNNIRPSYPDNALLSQSYLTNSEYCTAQWTEIKERMTRLTNLTMLL